MAILATGPACKSEPQRANVVIIVLDTLRRDHLGSYQAGDPSPSPHLDRLAQDGVRFTRAFSQASWTSASVGSMLTSQYPWRLGINGRSSYLPSEQVTLAEALEGAGYQTMATLSALHLGRAQGFHQGFQQFATLQTQLNDSPAQEVTDRALTWLESRDRSRPFFMMLHYFDPHGAYLFHDDPPPGCAPSYDATPLKQVAQEAGVDTRLLECAKAAYAAEVTWTDKQIGRVFTALHNSGTYDETLIIVTADHGEEFADHGSFGHGHTLYNELIAVPLLIKFPGEPKGKVDDRLAALLDVYPTVLDVADITPATALEGVSLRDGSTLSRVVMSETSLYRNHLRALITPEYRLAHNLNQGSSTYSHWMPTISLATIAAALAQHLREGAGPAVTQPPRQVLDDRQREILRSLGYIR